MIDLALHPHFILTPAGLAYAEAHAHDTAAFLQAQFDADHEAAQQLETTDAL